MSDETEQKSLVNVMFDLHARFPQTDQSIIEKTVHDAYLEFAGAPVRDYIPVMVERVAKNRIAALTRLANAGRAPVSH
jgi:predicted metalloprotease with PDZ domain